jgi:peptidoglycan hydrolase CwlO-like protein
MKRIVTLAVLLVGLCVTTFAQKDINAWKSEPNIEQQYDVFKENLNYWDGKYFLTPLQLDAYYNALNDSIAEMENKIATLNFVINNLESKLDSTNQQLNNTREELNASIEKRNTINFLGQDVGKSLFTLTMSMIIFALLAFLGVVFILYRRSQKITSKTKKDYSELKEEFETHKKNALERYTKINTELHHTRMKLKNQ